MFLNRPQNLAMERLEHFAAWNGSQQCRDSTSTRICCITTYVKGMTAVPSEGLKLALSRAAQGSVFALWVFPSNGFATARNWLPPRREDECTDC
jgi:hypothetical protein